MVIRKHIDKICLMLSLLSLLLTLFLANGKALDNQETSKAMSNVSGCAFPSGSSSQVPSTSG